MDWPVLTDFTLLKLFYFPANFITFITFGIIAYYIFRDPITTEGKEAVGELKKFPLFFGTVLFALEAIGVVCTIHYLTTMEGIKLY